MNKVILMGRLTASPELRYSTVDSSMAITRYTLAVDRPFAKDKENQADFIRIVAFGKGAEFASKYFHKGQRVLVEGHMQTGSYTNKEGQMVYTTDIIVERQEFADSLKDTTSNKQIDGAAEQTSETKISDAAENDDEIPFA